MLEAGDIGNVATFCQCLPSFLTAKPERVHASSFSDAAVREAFRLHLIYVLMVRDVSGSDSASLTASENEEA